MLKLLLNGTDEFLCHSIKKSFANIEESYKKKHKTIDLLHELEDFKEDPIGCIIGVRSSFQRDVKLKLKLVVGFFFVLFPMIVLSYLSYLANLHFTYAMIFTVFIALLASSRIEEISKRYVHSRMLDFHHQ